MWEEEAPIYGTPGVPNNFPINLDIQINYNLLSIMIDIKNYKQVEDY